MYYIFIVNIASWPRKKVLSGTMVHGLKGRCVVTWYETNSSEPRARIFRTKAHSEYHRKTIPCDFCREYSADIFYACIYISFERS